MCPPLLPFIVTSKQNITDNRHFAPDYLLWITRLMFTWSMVQESSIDETSCIIEQTC